MRNKKSFIPALKLARGETFTERHWSELMKMAGLSTSAERMVLQDLLSTRTSLMQNFNELRVRRILTLSRRIKFTDFISIYLKELNSRAAGESLVRQALAELEQWEIESRWTLVQHVDSGGIQLFIIKEYKDLLNKVLNIQKFGFVL